VTRRKKCRPGCHVDEPMRGGKRVRCSECGDEFPCQSACAHLDCEAARQGPWPAYPVADPWLGRPAEENAIPIVVGGEPNPTAVVVLADILGRR